MPAKKSSSNDKKRSTATASEADPPSAAPTAVAATASSSVKTEATAGKSKKTTRTVVVERTAAELGIRQRKLAHADDGDPTLQMLTQASAAAFTQEDHTAGSSTPPPLGGAAVAAAPTTASQRIAGAVVRAVAESGAGSSRRQQFSSRGIGDEDDDDLDAGAGGGPGRSKKKSRSELHGTTSGASRVNCRALATAQFNGALAALAAQPHHKQAFDICENSIVRRAGAAIQVGNSLSPVTAREATTARVPAAAVDVQSSNNPHDDPTRKPTAAAMDAAARRGLWGPLVPAAWCYGHSSSSASPGGSDGRRGGVCLPLTAAEAGWGPTQLLSSSAGGAPPSKHTELGVSAAASCYTATELADRSAVASTTMSVLVAGALRAADTRDRPMVSVKAAPPSVCCVCMGTARYTCVRCLGSNAVVCSSTCLQAHVATRCLKFVV